MLTVRHHFQSIRHIFMNYYNSYTKVNLLQAGGEVRSAYKAEEGSFSLVGGVQK